MGNGPIKHVGEDQVSCEVLSMQWDDGAAKYHAYRPFWGWDGVEDEQFKDLMGGLMNLDTRGGSPRGRRWGIVGSKGWNERESRDLLPYGVSEVIST